VAARSQQCMFIVNGNVWYSGNVLFSFILDKYLNMMSTPESSKTNTPGCPLRRDVGMHAGEREVTKNHGSARGQYFCVRPRAAHLEVSGPSPGRAPQLPAGTEPGRAALREPARAQGSGAGGTRSGADRLRQIARLPAAFTFQADSPTSGQDNCCAASFPGRSWVSLFFVSLLLRCHHKSDLMIQEVAFWM